MRSAFDPHEDCRQEINELRRKLDRTLIALASAIIVTHRDQFDMLHYALSRSEREGDLRTLLNARKSLDMRRQMWRTVYKEHHGLAERVVRALRGGFSKDSPGFPYMLELADAVAREEGSVVQS